MTDSEIFENIIKFHRYTIRGCWTETFGSSKYYYVLTNSALYEQTRLLIIRVKDPHPPMSAYHYHYYHMHRLITEWIVA